MFLPRKEQMKNQCCEVLIDSIFKIRSTFHIEYLFLKESIEEFYLVALSTYYWVQFYCSRVVVMRKEKVNDLFDWLEGLIDFLMRENCHLSSRSLQCFFISLEKNATVMRMSLPIFMFFKLQLVNFYESLVLQCGSKSQQFKIMSIWQVVSFEHKMRVPVSQDQMLVCLSDNFKQSMRRDNVAVVLVVLNCFSYH